MAQRLNLAALQISLSTLGKLLCVAIKKLSLRFNHCLKIWERRLAAMYVFDQTGVYLNRIAYVSKRQSGLHDEFLVQRHVWSYIDGQYACLRGGRVRGMRSAHGRVYAGLFVNLMTIPRR